MEPMPWPECLARNLMLAFTSYAALREMHRARMELIHSHRARCSHCYRSGLHEPEDN